MYCSACGQELREGAHFCDNCGAQLIDDAENQPIATTNNEVNEISTAPAKPRRGRGRPKDPYKEQIAALKLEIKQLKLDLKHITTSMAHTRAQYHETSAFVPNGMLQKGYKMLENVRLLGPQQEKRHLQKEIMDLEQELLNLQQAQLAWKEEQRAI